MHGSNTALYIDGYCKLCGQRTTINRITLLCVLSGCLKEQRKLGENDCQ